MTPSEYPQWTYTRDRKLVHTHPEVLTERECALSRLALAKHDALSKIIWHINAARLKKSGIILQEHIYFKKYLEARQFKDRDYDESDMLSYPYVLQYADLANISPRAAADEILLKAKLEDDELAKTEFLRLKFFNKVKEAARPEDLLVIQDEFLRELRINAIV